MDESQQPSGTRHHTEETAPERNNGVGVAEPSAPALPHSLLLPAQTSSALLPGAPLCSPAPLQLDGATSFSPGVLWGRQEGTARRVRRARSPNSPLGCWDRAALSIPFLQTPGCHLSPDGLLQAAFSHCNFFFFPCLTSASLLPSRATTSRPVPGGPLGVIYSLPLCSHLFSICEICYRTAFLSSPEKIALTL